MTLRKIIEDTKESLLQEKLTLEKLLREAPAGKFIYSKNTADGKTYYKWYVSITDQNGSKKKIYISRRNRGLAKQLAQKRLRCKRLRDVICQLKAMDSFLAKYKQNSDINDLLNVPLLVDLLEEGEPNPAEELSEELKRWAQEEYETNPAFP